MIHQLAGKIAFLFSEKKIIEPEKEAIYSYGMELLIATVVNGFIVFAASVIHGIFTETVIMFIPFIIVRSKAGGYHAKTHLGCIIAFNISYHFILFIIRLLEPTAYMTQIPLLFLLVSLSVLLLTGSIPNENRKVTNYELDQFKKKSRILAILLSVAGVLLVLILPRYGIYYASGLALAAGSMIAENIKIAKGKITHEFYKKN